MKIQILCDTPHSWIIPYAKQLAGELRSKCQDAIFLEEPDQVIQGDILIMLSCERIFKNLSLNTHNLVVHESDLPKGRGWSPVTWQVLQGAHSIPITLFEAGEAVDSGNIYGQEFITLKGTELVDEIRRLQAQATKKLLHDFVDTFPPIESKAQQGDPTYFRRRNREDSRLDIHKPLLDQFNLLRISDNERYPAWFELNGEVFELHIHKAE